MVPFNLTYSLDSVQGILNFTMDIDMLAHFDEWQRSRLDHEYEAQDQWPTELRRARLIPAVDYVQVLLFLVDKLQKRVISSYLIICTGTESKGKANKGS